jgi:hypothetical protein
MPPVSRVAVAVVSLGSLPSSVQLPVLPPQSSLTRPQTCSSAPSVETASTHERPSVQVFVGQAVRHRVPASAGTQIPSAPHSTLAEQGEHTFKLTPPAPPTALKPTTRESVR